MKTHLLLTLLFAGLIATTAKAQYCGNSGPQACTNTGSLTQNGFTPPENIPCISRNQPVSRTIEFRGSNSLFTPATPIIITSLRIDSILNLPPGLCWSTSDADNILDTVYDGCIKITGVTTALPGQYKLNLMVTVVSNLGTNSGSLDGLSSAFGTAPPIYLRVVDATNIVCPPIDTTQTDANGYLQFNGNYDSIAQISGKVFFDINQNSIYDNGDVVAAGRMLDIGADYIAQTNIGGDFTAYVPAGTYVIKPIIETLPHTPDSLVVHADNRGTNYTGNNLALIVTPGHCEGNLAIVAAIIPPRPGFYHDLSLQFHNVVSGGPISQTITLTYNAGEVFVGAVPAPSAIDTVGHTLTWNITNLASATTWQADITFYTNTTVGIGTINNYSAAISNSTCNSMNAITTSQDVPVRGSFDPNDKAASPAGEGPGGNIPPLSELTYTIRFQNTGTYQAETVKVMDTLSNFADVNSLKVLAASHNYQVLIKGNAVTFLFANINLPDSVNDEPNSHGYVQYKVKVKDNATVGTVINNTAFIYFDFNAPVVTNTTTNTLALPSGINTIANSTATMQLYPNPANDVVMINLSDNLTGGSLTLSDVTGRSLNTIAITSTHNQLNTGALASGVYLVTAVKGGVRVVQRLVVSR